MGSEPDAPEKGTGPIQGGATVFTGFVGKDSLNDGSPDGLSLFPESADIDEDIIGTSTRRHTIC